MTLREKLNGDIAACRQAQAQFANDAEQARVLAILNDGAAQQLAQTLGTLPVFLLDSDLEPSVSEQEAAEFDALGDLELRPPMTQVMTPEGINKVMREIEQARGE
jgi:hypothetical protein